MKKPMIFLFLILAVFSFSIFIKTNESKVEVYIDNTLRYTLEGTGLLLDGKGKADVKLSLPGYWPVDYELKDVDLSSTRVVEVNFYPVTEATITGISTSSEIYILNGNVEIFVGKAPYRGIVPLGKHIFKVITPDGFEYTLERNITTETQTVNLFKSLSIDLVIDSTPKASLYVDGIYKGTTPAMVTLNFKRHKFEFYNKGFLVGSCSLEIMDEKLKILDGDVVGIVKDKNRLYFRLRKVVKTVISSFPEGAFFELEGKVYKTPEILDLIEATNVIEAFMPGYKGRELIFNPVVKPYVRIDLEPDQKDICINSKGELFVNGEYKGTGPTVVNLKRGIYVLGVVRGEDQWVSLVDVSTNTELDLNDSNGTLVIGDVGTVKLNEGLILTPAILNLSPGNYEITKISKDGSSITETLTIKRGKLTYYPEDSALIFLETLPPGIQVNLDGRYYTTPLVLIPVDPGEVNLRFQYKCASLEKKIKVEKGKINFLKIAFNISFNEKDAVCPILIEER